ncbi:DNA mismatch repair endonuclease MutL [Clostridium aciditolerans]|uniref:DNA mismatch repair protein MutL n=1 Tax=Clostridium aciditolerans TaxID=339861 RepID=A0A934HXB4_9CLOT|nr:DNA mismatch repair endonuclease MutL [Clostridium aciditolerans]MBI6872483.1 DNA mismatch repair endonuclease MutL [Clostridium aciditolerans]
MKRINILDIETSNKIAAGEVVERPSSVVKELIENSIDSEAKNITVEIEDGGQKSIKVLDDGHGIHPEDIEKAFMPHATSKINSINDIYSINTMGFRGEALASIAAVSNTVLKSRTEEYDYGKETSINGGVLDYIKDAGCNVGTTIEIKDLFFNVPARKKFLKSSSREAAYISDILNRLALANPDVSFKLFNNGKKVLNTYGTGKLTDAIRAVYGKSISDNIIAFEKHSDISSIHGFIGNAEISRGSRNNQSIFVNKRYIKSKLITAAVENAFKSFLTVNKYPFFVVFLDIFPEFIDVNVHPTKSEIKFRDDRGIFKLTFDAVHEALRNSLRNSFDIPFDDEIREKDEESNYIKKEISTIQLPIDLNTFNESNYKVENYGNNKNYECNQENNSLSNGKNDLKELSYNAADSIKESEVSKQNTSLDINSNEGLSEQSNLKENIGTGEELKEEKIAKFPALTIIGQFRSTYILAEASDNLYLIDQHAAHEKILFEKYKKSIQENKVMSQVLITPAVIELTPEDYDYYLENSDIFKKSGFNIEVFGENTISIREVPLILGKPDIKNLFMDMLDNLKNMGSGQTWEIKYNSIAKLACKSAVKANDSLSSIEMKTLTEDLRFIEDPFTCPHGRPTIMKFTLNELEKRFKRIQ